MMSDTGDAAEQKLAALLAEAKHLPKRELRRLDLSAAETLLLSLQNDVRGVATPAPQPPPRPSRASIATLDADILDVEPEDSDIPMPLSPPRGAENREVRSPTRTRPSRPPTPRFDAIADAVSTAALHAEARRQETPPPLPKASEFDIVLSEDDLIDLEPGDEEVEAERPSRRLTVAEMLEED